MGASVAMVIGGLLPRPDILGIVLGTGKGVASVYVWPWEFQTRCGLSWFDVWAPFAWAAVGFISLLYRGVWRGVCALLGSIALVGLDAVVVEGSRELTIVEATGVQFCGGFTTALVASIGLVAITAGNHVRKRAPTDRVPMLMTGFGGVLCFASALIGCQSFVSSHTMRGGAYTSLRSPPELLFKPDEWSHAQTMLLLGLVALALAGPGARAFATTDVAGRCARTSRLARILLFAHPIAVFGVAILSDYLRHMEPLASLTIALRASTLFGGAIVLVSTGLATWLETATIRRAEREAEGAPLPSR
jgi:hypothetical protein